MRRVRRKGANKEKVFGCDLLEHLNASSQEIPQVLRCCSEFVETHGIVDGIYRLSGVSSNIQKLRTDFESDGTPDLNKDVYLQDIHCVSSLCKAYFRELPNPLLTYQLYDKFAEAVAIQLEEDRLVKIRDVLKELPSPHYRTLEYLMRHLVKMASFSSETNMHARNLAIVWAPNLLRSKDIEASGFNGTAVFKEVRVQSIVVEFILTHVPQLFPEQGGSQERRKSLPSESTESNQDGDPFKFPRTQAVLNFGNICPTDAPLPIRPYHAIIEGTDKRKGSLKGRKWMSIFNIGSRFHDPLRRHKHSAKEKDRSVLRPARSMDSLSSPPYPNEGSRRTSQHPPNKTSPLVTPPTQPGSGTNAFTGAIGGSEYAVTYRRGTGVVGGNGGNQGTSPALDLEGFNSTDHEAIQARSSGDSAKMSRRAAMHITGPTLVTVPLHITTNLAYGVLQREGGERIIHYGREKDGKCSVSDKEKAEEMKMKNEEGEKNDKEVLMDRIEDTEACGQIEGESEGKKEKQQEKQEDCGYTSEMVMANGSREQPEILSSGAEEAKVVTDETDNEEAGEYMVMKSTDADFEQVLTQHNEIASNISDNLNLTEAEEDDLTLSGYVEDSFEFLDHMDCSVLDHMDCSVPYQVHEFSVEPPGHSDDEYELMEQGRPSHQSDQHQMLTQPLPETESQRMLSVNTHSRHIKSLSLPYMTSPIHGPEESGSDDDDDDDDDNAGDYYSSEDEESMFIKSLPCDFFLKELSGNEPEIERQDKYAPEVHPVCVQIAEDAGFGRSACIESPGDQKQIDIKDSEVNEGWEENELSRREDKDNIHQEAAHLEAKGQRTAAGESSSIADDPQSSDNNQQPLKAEASTYCCSKYPASADKEPGVAADAALNKQKEVVDRSDSNYADSLDSETVAVLFEESKDLPESASEPADREDREKEEMHRYKERGDVLQDIVLKTSANDERIWNVVADIEPEEEMEESSKSSGIWDDHVDVAGEITKQEGDMQHEIKSAGQSEVVEVMGLKTAKVDFKDGETSEREVRTEAVKESRPVKKLEEPEIQLETEEKRATLEKTEELETNQCHVITNKRWSQDRGEGFSADKEKSERDSGLKAVGKKLVISKHPKVHQVKAVPVVPPKPQHCRITALTLRQQQQQQQQHHHHHHQAPSVRDRLDSDRGKETAMKVAMQQDDICEGEHEKDGDKGSREKEKPKLRGGEREGGIDVRRNSPLFSMCFDEAVAIATMRREKEKEYEKERQRDWGNEMQ